MLKSADRTGPAVAAPVAAVSCESTVPFAVVAGLSAMFLESVAAAAYCAAVSVAAQPQSHRA